ncbi:transcription-repair coupling factor [candidate division KSB1 bacterium]
MTFSKTFSRFYRVPLVKRFITKFSHGDHFAVSGLAGTSTTALLAGIAGGNSPVFVLVPDYKTLETLQADLEVITGVDVSSFPAYRGLNLEDKPINKDIKLTRLKCLQNLCSKNPGLYLIEVRSLLHTIIMPEDFRRSLIELKINDEVDLTTLIELLSESGFQRESMAGDFGEMSVRGGIIDVFSPSMLEPVRIEVDYDTVVSIRTFDINTQRSIRHIDRIAIIPPLTDITAGMQPGLPQEKNSILSYFPEDTPIFLHRPEQARKALADYFDFWSRESEIFRDSDASHAGSLFREIEKSLRARKSAYIKNTFTSPGRLEVLRFHTKTLPKFQRNLKMFARYVDDVRRDYPGLNIMILCDNQGQADRLKNIILDDELFTSNYSVHVGSLSEGFIFPEGNMLLINDHEIFSRKYLKRPKKIYRARKVLFDELSLSVGDNVVHEDYGIGRYLGLEKIKIGLSEQEALKLQYRDGDTLFLNLEKLPHLEKYTGQEGHQPELSKLGGADWTRLKSRTKRSLQNITNDLLEIYARRETASGFAFSADTQWQRELEASFQYDETPDQFKAVWDIKKDMELPRPMDRLICGDVGYGKTEVALRAAFKVVNDSKQTGILVPTTILAQQHFETFRERLGQFPVNIEMLSRFRTKKEQAKIVEGLKNGTVDIVIGTHRMLSKDVAFKDLGLLIVDEEQRFGVRHKEKLKKLRAEVDVLTLTATPIPRTLHLSLLGVRDLSTITTPPKNRLPIITEISEYNEELIRAAIMKELDRGGQVYFVHNRVQTINKMVTRLENIVPEARYGIAHGQMKEKELEQVMMSFLRGDFNVLVSTMIIESGLDIPSVNTIIINQADNFGLAQLYQLRGRVGRSDIQAFSYLLTPPFERMSDVAISRLQTLSEHTELGSGLQIAMKDLEIRGAGNLLGAEQSGHINAVGYDMYTRLVKESVSEQMQEILPGQEPEIDHKVQDVRIDSDISAYLPDDYIPDQFQRVSFYRKLANIGTTEELDDYKKELLDRYGRLPKRAERLTALMHIKLVAAKLLMRHFKIANNKFTATFLVDSEATVVQKEQLAALVSSFVDKTRFAFRLKQDVRLKIELPLKEDNPDEKLETVLNFLNYLL